MKHFKRANIYKASNVSFNPETNEAYSYDWWCFVKRVNGKTVFNKYNYSPSTIKHQYKVRDLLRDLDIKIDLEVECPSGLHSNEASLSCDKHYTSKIQELKDQISRPRSQARKNLERECLIAKYAEECVDFKLLIEKMSQP